MVVENPGKMTTRTCPTCGNPYPSYVSRCPDDGTLLRSGGPPTLKPEPNTIAGTTIDGRYYVGRLIGKGAMGRVYRGNQLSVGRAVAIKVLRKNLSKDPEVRRRFLREAKLISEFSHPNIVRLIDFGQSDDLLYIVMEYIDGVPLQRIIRGRPTRIDFALEIASQLCGPLVEAHAAGVTHRDLKPDNIFLTRAPGGTLQIKVLDFGIARVERKKAGADLTREGMVFGTPEYMSPEQARGKNVGPSTDLYATGVLLYEMLTGELPILGLSPTETMVMQIQTRPQDPRELNPEIPDAVAELVNRLLDKDPAGRPESTEVLQRAVEDIRRDLECWPIREIPDGDLGFVLENEFVQARTEPVAALAFDDSDRAATDIDELRRDTRMGVLPPSEPSMTAAVLFAVGSLALLVAAVIIAIVFG